MATLTRFVPFRPVFNDFNLQTRVNMAAEGSFVPAVDVFEDAQTLTLQVEAPGIQPEAIDVRIENRTLTIRGERKLRSEVKEENVQRIERRYGSFTRTFTLPTTVDTDSVQATAENGILTLTFARKAESKPRQIEVKVGVPQVAIPQTAVQTPQGPDQASAQPVEVAHAA